MILTKLDKIQMYICILSNVYVLSAKASSLLTLRSSRLKKLNTNTNKIKCKRENLELQVIWNGNWMIDWALDWVVMRQWLVFGKEDFFCLEWNCIKNITHCKFLGRWYLPDSIVASRLWLRVDDGDIGIIK